MRDLKGVIIVCVIGPAGYTGVKWPVKAQSGRRDS
jgi:hypothetical protein